MIGFSNAVVNVEEHTPAHIATVARVAFEGIEANAELSQEPTKQFESFLDRRSHTRREPEGNEPLQPARRTTTVADTQGNALSQQTSRSDAVTAAPRQNIKVPDLLSSHEVYHIKQAAAKLSAERSSAQLLWSWIAIAVFLVSLTGAYIRTATSSTSNQTGHTLAVVMLFSY